MKAEEITSAFYTRRDLVFSLLRISSGGTLTLLFGDIVIEVDGAVLFTDDMAD